MSIETKYKVAFIAEMAMREKQIQQKYRPVIAVHKWFARRPGTLFRGLLLSEFSKESLEQSFFAPNDLSGKVVVDPFMGGGTPLMEANRVGCNVVGCDINPMAAWIVREEIQQIDLVGYRREGERLIRKLESEIGEFYLTDCPSYGDKDVPVKYFLWVKTIPCENCAVQIDLFPGYLIADDTRHSANVLVCASCGDLNEVKSLEELGHCKSCNTILRVDGPAKRGQCVCQSCRHANRYPRPGGGPLNHRMFAIEYYNPQRREIHHGRFFKKPDDKDLRRAKDCAARWARSRELFVPDEAIASGDESDRLHRWGYRFFRELFNERQLLGLNLSCSYIHQLSDKRLRDALATNLSDLLRYQNMLCRYDTMALKSLDIFSVHGFPVGLIQCESNLLGITNGNGISVGSGGWRNIFEKYTKAKGYCDEPYEVSHVGRKKVLKQITGEWIGETRAGCRPRTVDIRCADSASIRLEPETVDAVFTDPPYFGNVQYGELMDFCYCWLQQLAGKAEEGFKRKNTRSANELTGNVTQARGIEHFADGISRVYQNMGRALKPAAPLVFTFHHNKIEPYFAIGVAILDAEMMCSAALPCPAEMGGSIHIHGTNSAIVDTVFVCRKAAYAQNMRPFRSEDELIKIIREDVEQLRLAGLQASNGDIRCMTMGHVTRMAVWNLSTKWDKSQDVSTKLSRFSTAIDHLPKTEQVLAKIRAKENSRELNSETNEMTVSDNISDAIPI